MYSIAHNRKGNAETQMAEFHPIYIDTALSCFPLNTQYIFCELTTASSRVEHTEMDRGQLAHEGNEREGG